MADKGVKIDLHNRVHPKTLAEIIKMNYGIGYDYPMDPDDIADHFGLTRTRVNQIIASSIKDMRNNIIK